MHDRGNGMVYDDEQDITWLQSANYAKQEFAANPNRITEIIEAVNAKGGVSGQQLTALDFNQATGQMTWFGATAWSDQLVYGGFSDWRLPHTAQPDPTCLYQDTANRISSGADCRGSEMGHLYYVDFANYSPEKHPLLNGARTTASGVEFKGIGVFYWSDLPSSLLSDEIWFFNFHGYQATNVAYSRSYFAWGVRDGDVLPNVTIERARWKAGSHRLIVSGKLQYGSGFSVLKRRELRETYRITIMDAASNTPIALDVLVKRDGSWRAAFMVNGNAVSCSVKADFAGKQSGAVAVTNAPTYCQ